MLNPNVELHFLFSRVIIFGTTTVWRTHLAAGLLPPAQQIRKRAFGAKFKIAYLSVFTTEPKMPLVYEDICKFDKD